MNVRNLETFHESLICHYRELIQEAILESETHHKTNLDIGKLNAKLKVITKAAHYDGLSDDIITRLIEEVMPEEKAA